LLNLFFSFSTVSSTLLVAFFLISFDYLSAMSVAIVKNQVSFLSLPEFVFGCIKEKEKETKTIQGCFATISKCERTKMFIRNVFQIMTFLFVNYWKILLFKNKTIFFTKTKLNLQVTKHVQFLGQSR
jgi:hypothetical protein